MADVSKIKLPDGTTYNIKDTVSGYITTVPVTSVNEQTGDVTITEGLEPLIGTTSTVTPQQVMTALEEGRDICITATASVLIVMFPIDMSVKFTAFTRVTDIPNSGQGMDVVVSQAIVKYNNAYAVIDLYGGIIGGESKAWTVDSNFLATSDALESVQNSIPTSVSQLTNDSGFITGYTETDPTVPSWAKASTKPTYTASEVGALSGNSGGVFYGTCSTAAGTVAKVVECASFTADNLKAGAIIIVTFTATNSGAVASLTMNVNSTGAKPIKYINNGSLGNLSSAGYLKANVEYPFYYDGTNWVVWMNYNTTYSALSEADMQTGTATSSRTITAQRLKQAVEYHAPVTSVNGSTGDVTVTVPTKTSELTNDSGFLTSAPVTSVNGRTGAVTINVPTKTSDLTNDGESGSSGFVTGSDVNDIVGWSLLSPTFCATDATTQAVLQQAFGTSADVIVPSDITSTLSLLQKLEPRTWFCWMNGAEMEFARMSVSVNTSNSAITLYLRGRTSIATGIMGVDSSWTVTPIPSVPTAVSELTNDSGYLTLADLPIYNGGVQ